MSCKRIRSNATGGSYGRRQFASIPSEDTLPYIVWDSTATAGLGPGDEYGPPPSLHSHPASIITYNHIPPMINSCQASSTLSWDSTSISRRCCSPACCAILLTAILILAALLTVIGIAVYLGIITNLSKATILPVSGRFRVISGDDFVPSLYNTSSTAFLEKAEKYNAIIHSALQWTSIDISVIKSEVYAFRKGSLIVHFRIYLDRKKIIQARNSMASQQSKKSTDSKLVSNQKQSEDKVSSSSRNDNLIPSLVKQELKEGLIQLRMIGPGRPEIDYESLIVTSYHTDPMLNLKDQSMPLQVRGNMFYERNDGDQPIDTVLSAIHLKPLKSSTRKPTLVISTKETTTGTTLSTATSTSTSTTTSSPSSKSSIKHYQSKLSIFDSNNIENNNNNLNNLSDDQRTLSSQVNNRRHSNYHHHLSESPSLFNRFAERLRPSRPSFTTVRPVTASTAKSTTELTTRVSTVITRAPNTTSTTTTTTTRKPFVLTTRRLRLPSSSTSTTSSTTTTKPTLSTTKKTSTTTMTTTTTTTTSTTTPEPPIAYTEVVKSTSRNPGLFTRKTTRTRIDFPSLLAGLRSTIAPPTTASVGTISPIPPHHKPPPGTSIKVTSLDFGQWRPLSPFRPLNQPKSPPIKLTPSSSPSSLQSPFSSQSQFTHLKPPLPSSSSFSSSFLDFSSPMKNRLVPKPGQNKVPMVIAVSPGDHIRRRIPISVL